jgi:hypothetical protein
MRGDSQASLETVLYVSIPNGISTAITIALVKQKMASIEYWYSNLVINQEFFYKNRILKSLLVVAITLFFLILPLLIDRRRVFFFPVTTF